MTRQWRAARLTTASPVRACITIPVITLRTSSIPTVTVSRRSIRAGNTPKHNASEFQEGPPFTLTKRRVQARHTEPSAISAPESNSNAQNVSDTSELPQKRPPLLLILHNVLQPAPLRFGQRQLDCR